MDSTLSANAYVDGKLKRIQREVRIAPACINQREASKIADELLVSMNRGIESHGSATNFGKWAVEVYLPIKKSLLASSTYERYEGVIENYLMPVFGPIWCSKEVFEAFCSELCANCRGRNG